MTARAMPTALIEFDSAHCNAVAAAIDKCGNPPRPDLQQRLDDTAIIHFASLGVIEVAGPKSYIFAELNADGDEDAALAAFAAALAPDLLTILDAAGIAPPPQLATWLVAKKLRIGLGPRTVCGLPFDGSPAMTVRRIKAEDRLASWIVDRPALLRGAGSPAQKLAALRRALWDDGGFKPAFVPQPAPFLQPAPPLATWQEKLRAGAAVAFQFLIWPSPVLPILIILLALLPHKNHWPAHLLWSALWAVAILVIAVGAFLLALRRLEQTDPAPDAQPDPRALEDILKRENFYAHNILMTVSILKPARLRRFTLQLALFGVKTLLPLFWAPGRLGDINDIHFARWVLLPGTNVLVFRSNYDGSWVNYLEDFVLRAPTGVTAIWSNTLGFPRTSWLALDGAKDGPRFLQWARTQTRPAPFWYSAYPDLSMERIRLQARLARAVATGTMDDGVRGWLTSLGDSDGGDF
jgi:hypothetical protein